MPLLQIAVIALIVTGNVRKFFHSSTSLVADKSFLPVRFLILLECCYSTIAATTQVIADNDVQAFFS